MKAGVALTTSALLMLFCGVLDASGSTRDSQPPHDRTGRAVPASPSLVHTGEEVFMTNCSRCHTPPMAIAQRVTGTVITHMRVRARLSRQDEQLLLKYLAP